MRILAFLLGTTLVVVAGCTGNITSATGSDGGGGDDDGIDSGPRPDGRPGADAGPQPDAGPPAPDAGAPPPGAYFPNGAIWYQDVSSAPVDPDSEAVIGYLQGFGWATNGILQIDFGLEVLQAGAGTEFREFTPTSDFFSGDCDLVEVPIPVGGALEGQDGYACPGGGDCHLIVVDTVGQKLYEMWRANITATTFFGGCLAVWDMQKVYGQEGRGNGCTSADAAGYPIAPLLFSADEVAAGSIDHAIRFILPNARIRADVFYHPATHTTSATAGPAQAPPYGAHLRLKASFDESTLANDGARVVARALKKYGMFLADGGTVPLTAQSDRFTVAKWNGLLEARDLEGIEPGDFELLVLPDPEFPISTDCERTPP